MATREQEPREIPDGPPPEGVGPSDPRVPTPHPPWTKIVTIVILAAFLLSILVGALL